MATLQEAVIALENEKVVLADWAGRRVTVNQLVQNGNTNEWYACWSHSDYPDTKWHALDGDETFIIRGKYGRYR